MVPNVWTEYYNLFNTAYTFEPLMLISPVPQHVYEILLLRVLWYTSELCLSNFLCFVSKTTHKDLFMSSYQMSQYHFLLYAYSVSVISSGTLRIC